MNHTSTENLTQAFLQSLIKGDRMHCSQLAKSYISQGHHVMDLYENVFKEALYEVGKLWETNKISVATEHLATAITEGILNELYGQLIFKKSIQKKVVVACVEHEMHQVGVKMVADVFEMNGWESFFLGTGVPTNELIRYIHEVKPDVLAISLSVYFNYAAFLNMLKDLRQAFPDLVILIGGQAFSRVSKNQIDQLENIIHISDLYALDKLINAWNVQH